jgi:hypothetical protein
MWYNCIQHNNHAHTQTIKSADILPNYQCQHSTYTIALQTVKIALSRTIISIKFH